MCHGPLMIWKSGLFLEEEAVTENLPGCLLEGYNVSGFPGFLGG